MTKFLITAIALFFSPFAFASEKLFSYTDFGPPCVAFELIGKDWWQWNNHGDDNPKTRYPIKVVVYWNQSEEKTKARFPVNEKKLRDYRYVSRDSAIAYLRQTIREFHSSGLDVSVLKATLARLEKK